ncbi:deoxycytidylate deaminase-like [Aulostomus maculatus]
MVTGVKNQTSGLSTTEPRRPHVGACMVSLENKIVGPGYNCMPNGGEGRLPWERSVSPSTSEDDSFLETKYAYVCHAELNAIINSSANVKDCTIIQAGLTAVVFVSDKYLDQKQTRASKEMLRLAGLTPRQLEPRNHKITISFNPYDEQI